MQPCRQVCVAYSTDKYIDIYSHRAQQSYPHKNDDNIIHAYPFRKKKNSRKRKRRKKKREKVELFQSRTHTNSREQKKAHAMPSDGKNVRQ